MHQNLEIRLVNQAVEVVKTAYIYLEKQQTGLGKIFVYSLDKTFQFISNHPTSFQKIDFTKRQALVGKFPFIVVYEIFDQFIMVYAVFSYKKKTKIYK